MSVPFTRDDALAEDFTSLGESAEFIISHEDADAFIPCEGCGLVVSAVREKDCSPWPHAIPAWNQQPRFFWEPALGRRHTLRRCQLVRSVGLVLDEAAESEQYHMLAAMYGFCECHRVCIKIRVALPWGDIQWGFGCRNSCYVVTGWGVKSADHGRQVGRNLYQSIPFLP